MAKNITFSVEEDLLEKARSKAMLQHRSLNEAFREWIRQYAYAGKNISSNYATLMKRFSKVDDGCANEEWFGVFGQGDGSQGPFLREPRKIYDVIKTEWTGL